MTRTTRISSAVVLITVLTALLAGMGSGLARLGWHMDSLSSNWILVHGPLMISGFLGTLICMERAVALASRYRWGLIVPMVNAIGALALLIMRDAQLAKSLLVFGSLGLMILFCLMLRLHPSRDVLIMALGSVSWVLGNILWWMGQPIYQVVHLWTAFLILTIVGERLELSRVRHLTRTSQNLLNLSVGIYGIGCSLTIFNLELGVRLLGIGAILMAGWLLRYDIARRTVQQNGLPRYIAVCLLAGYIWLGFGGLLAIWYGALYAGMNYAAVLHAFLLGFVFSMIFGHAPIIIPALTGLQFRYHPILYSHLILLHIALIYRMYGNIFANFTARQQGGLLNAIAILLFITIMMGTMFRSNMKQKSHDTNS